jgi:class 3 adenylate cyclase
MGRLKRFFSPQVSELVVSSGGEQLLRSHLQEVTVVFCDLRGFTAFSEATEPDDVMAVLRECHEAIGAVTNLTSRLCDHAEGGQILISQPVFTAMKHEVEAEPVGKLSLKGLAEPVPAFNVLGCKATR